MLARLHSIAINGIDAEVVEVELDLASGMAGFILVGLPDQAVQESRDRVRSALLNSGYQFPAKRLVLNLAPAELRKEGGVYDLPIALAILAASEQLDPDRLGAHLVLGELALDGSLRPVRGVLAAAITARQRGFRGVVVPRANAREASVVDDSLEVIGVDSLEETVGVLSGCLPVPDLPEETAEEGEVLEGVLDYADVRGHEGLKRALTVAAAGNHNVILLGPPGSGKTMAAKRLPTILPELHYAEALETTKIHSIAGALPSGRGLLTRRPFRSPHHSVSAPGLIGGGTVPSPGEVSLAHNGVLFLDEAPEFSRTILETLRQPLEDGVVTISRAAGSATYPARIMLVASQNMCPCGRRGDPRKQCRCSPRAVEQYLGRLSGPLLDRIDIQMEVPALSFEELRSRTPGPSSAEMRSEVTAARAVQRERYAGKTSPVNAQMSEPELGEHAGLSPGCESLLRAAMDELGLSARGHARILKLARTIADLDAAAEISEAHLGEAIQYRALDRAAAY